MDAGETEAIDACVEVYLDLNGEDPRITNSYNSAVKAVYDAEFKCFMRVQT